MLSTIRRWFGPQSNRRQDTRRQAIQRNGLAAELLEERLLLSASGTEYRTVDGAGNNAANPDWGSTDEAFLRFTTVDYADGIELPGEHNRHGARLISNHVLDQAGSIINDRHLTDLVWQWGQFLDHDIDLTDGADPAEAYDIKVPHGDPLFDPQGSGDKTMSLSRSKYAVWSGTGADNPRQQVNSITAYIDASNVYGSDAVRAAALRTFSAGKLKTSDGNLLPYNTAGLPNAGGPGGNLFLAGDVRANEQVGLISMHTLFVREHNRLAAEIAARDFAGADLNEAWVDEAIYQEARRIVAAQMQVITYNEFLPALLGPDSLADYGGYDPWVDAGITNVFAAASYRFGHSMVSGELLRLDNDGNVIAGGNLALRDAFFRPDKFLETGPDAILKGLTTQLSQEIDAKLVDDLRNFLFGPPGSGGFDLAALNIQRGRDHGLAGYNQTRVDFGLEPMHDFTEITSDVQLQQKLQTMYGTVDDIDVWVGGLAEDHLPNSSVGALLNAVFVDQFERLRDGDRFWYRNDFSGEELWELESTKLSDIIRRNTSLTNIQDHVFFSADVQAPNPPQQTHFITSTHNTWDATPDLEWSAATCDVTYELHVYRLSEGRLFVHETDLTNPRYETQMLPRGESYQIFVRAKNEIGMAAWSAPIFISVTDEVAPGGTAITSGGGHTGDDTPRLDWSESVGAAHYEVLVYDVSYGREAAHLMTPDRHVSLPQLSRYRSYQVFVRGCNEFGNGQWAAPVYVNLGGWVPDAPQWLMSSLQLSTTTPELYWTPMGHDAKYEVHIYHHEDGQRVVYETEVVTPYLQVNLQSGHHYQMFVRAIGDGGPGAWAAPVDLQIAGNGESTDGRDELATQFASILDGDASDGNRAADRLANAVDESPPQHETADTQDVSNFADRWLLDDEATDRNGPPVNESALDELLANWPQLEWWLANGLGSELLAV